MDNYVYIVIKLNKHISRRLCPMKKRIIALLLALVLLIPAALAEIVAPEVPDEASFVNSDAVEASVAEEEEFELYAGELPETELEEAVAVDEEWIDESEANWEDDVAAANAGQIIVYPFAYANAKLQSESEEVVMSGISYSDAILFASGYNGGGWNATGEIAEVTYNFNGWFSQMTFIAGYAGGAKRDATMTVIANGSTLYDHLVIKYDRVAQSYSIPLSGVTQLIIRFESKGYDNVKYAIANINQTVSTPFKPGIHKSCDGFSATQAFVQNTEQIYGAFSMGGFEYENGYKMMMGYNGYSTGPTAKLSFNLQGDCKSMSFDIAKIMNRNPEWYTRSAYLTIELDGQAVGAYDNRELKWNDLCLPVSLNTAGVTEVMIQIVSEGYDKVYWGIGNIQMESRYNITKLTLEPKSFSLALGSTRHVQTTVVHPNASTAGLTWSTSNAKVATVDKGDVTAVGKGTATITVTAPNGVKASCTVTVARLDVKNAFIEFSMGETERGQYVYAGEPVKPKIRVFMDQVELIKDKDYTVSYSANTKPGKASLTIKGIGNYKGKQTRNFTIYYDLTGATIELKDGPFFATNNKKEVKPGIKSVTIAVAGKTIKIKSTTGYNISYENNTEPGTGTLTITGKNNCRNSASTTFTIEKPKTSKPKGLTFKDTKSGVVVIWNAVEEEKTGSVSYDVYYYKSNKKNTYKNRIRITTNGQTPTEDVQWAYNDVKEVQTAVDKLKGSQRYAILTGVAYNVNYYFWVEATAENHSKSDPSKASTFKNKKR